MSPRKNSSNGSVAPTTKVLNVCIASAVKFMRGPRKLGAILVHNDVLCCFELIVPQMKEG